MSTPTATMAMIQAVSGPEDSDAGTAEGEGACDVGSGEEVDGSGCADEVVGLGVGLELVGVGDAAV